MELLNCSLSLVKTTIGKVFCVFLFSAGFTEELRETLGLTIDYRIPLQTKIQMPWCARSFEGFRR
ncbi:MAG TPA: hypothetical protein DEW97_02745 [Sutterella wadsworthensis]|nr:hypothetical protein [Sutterella wadsworthensis]